MRLELEMDDGTRLDLPPTLKNITTYVVLEQGRWFEKETRFLTAWLKPDMTVIDIGANVGVYSLPMARQVRWVFAYEPGSDARDHLERGRRLNRLDNLEIIPTALSDSPREGYLTSGHSNELNRLGESGEKVHITSLDHEDSVRAWSPDFIKIDAEFEEPRVVEGGRKFFAQRSPLVMYEIADKPGVPQLVEAFATLGYRSYRCLPTVPLLVPYGADDPIAYEVNLFAAKPDRTAALAKEGFLVESAPSWQPDEATRAGGLALLRAQQFSAPWASLHLNAVDPAYRDALAGYGAWLTSRNYGALLFALATLSELCERDPNLARQSTLARVAHEAGARSISVGTLQALMARLRHDQTVTEPFWPASPSFDNTAPGEDTLADCLSRPLSSSWS